MRQLSRACHARLLSTLTLTLFSPSSGARGAPYYVRKEILARLKNELF